MAPILLTEPLSREVASDRSPRVERSETLGPKPFEGSPGRGVGTNGCLRLCGSPAYPS